MCKSNVKMLLQNLICSFLFGIATGYEIGAPISTCIAMFPKHEGRQKQMTPSPFRIVPSLTVYNPSDLITVRLSANDGRIFTGIQITAHRQKGDKEVLLGSFVSFPENKTKALGCIGGKDNFVTHKNKDPVTEIVVTWRAPDQNVGNVTFRATFVESYHVFWWNVTADIASVIPMDQSVTNQLTKSAISMQLEECGTSMGCFLYPKYCTGSNCDMGLTYTTSGDHVTFTLFTRENSGYISVGFSEDKLMGDDQTVTCTNNGKAFSIQNGYNPFMYNERQYLLDRISNMSTAYIDGTFYCTFARPKALNISKFGKPQSFDLARPHYVMLARGDVKEDTDVLSHHKELPVTTTEKVYFDQYKIYRGEALPMLTQVHGMLMLIAWIMFGGLTTVIARFYKPLRGGKAICGTNYWFQIHRGVAILAGAITAASFIIIFVKVLGLTKTAKVHGWIGIAVMAAVVLQILAGLIRPNPQSSARPLFNWGHWFLGKSLHILAAICCFFAFFSDLIPKTQSLFGIIVIAAWVGVQLIWEIMFEIQKCRNEGSNKYEFKEKGTPKSSTADKTLLGLYCFCLLLLVVAAALSIYLF